MILVELEPDWWVRLDLLSNMFARCRSVGEEAVEWNVALLLHGGTDYLLWKCKDEAEARERVAYLVSMLWNHADTEGCVTCEKENEARWRAGRVRP